MAPQLLRRRRGAEGLVHLPIILLEWRSLGPRNLRRISEVRMLRLGVTQLVHPLTRIHGVFTADAGVDGAEAAVE